MKPQLRTIIAALACMMVASGAVAQDRAEFDELEVGRTRILCYTEPCPWNGIADVNAPTNPVTMLWSGAEPPPMVGTARDTTYIRKHYADECTLVLGRYAEGVLEISKILGAC